MKSYKEHANGDLRLGFVGYGAIGSALGELARTQGSGVNSWDVDGAKCSISSLSKLVAASDVIFICLRTAELAAVASEVSAAVEARRPLLLTVAKGVASGFKTPDQILQEAVKGRCDIGVFCGPMLAAEVRQQGRLAGVLAISDRRWEGCLDGIFGDRSKVEYTDRVPSIAVCGVLKNIYSVAFGLAAGLNWGFNDRGRLMVAVMNELRRVLPALGGDTSDVYGLAGIGDLLATSSSDLSFNYRAGLSLAAGKPTGGEGINSLREVGQVLDTSPYPILDTLGSIIRSQAQPDSLWRVIVDAPTPRPY